MAPRSLFDGGQFPTQGHEARRPCAPTRPATWAPSRPHREGRGGRRRARGPNGAGGSRPGRDRHDLLREGRPARRAVGLRRSAVGRLSLAAPQHQPGAHPAGVVPDALRVAGLSLARAHRRVLRCVCGVEWGWAIGSGSGRLWNRRRGWIPAAGWCEPRTASRGSSTCWWWRAATTGSRGCPTRRTPARSTGASCTRTTTARPRSSPGAGCWWWGWATPSMDIAVESSTVAEAHVPLHPARHADRAQVRVRQARRPGHLADDGAAAVAAAPAAHAPAAAPGGRQAGDLRAARPRLGLPARPPHDLRRRAVAAHPRRDRRAPGREGARRRRGGVRRRHRARSWTRSCGARATE